MRSRLGSLFLTAALGPLQYAGQCIMARRVEDGLRQLTGPDLLDAFQRGIAAVAKEVGVSTGAVASLLPVSDMTALAARIAHHQANAVEQWHLHAGDTGLLDGVADLTVDGRAPDASLCLLRLSAKMKLDKQLAAPLRELSEDLDRWQQLLEASRVFIEDGEVLKKAHRQRRLVRLGIALSAVLALTAGLVWFTRVSLARGRIDDALVAGDPCVVTIDPADRGKASSAQEAALVERQAACEAQRAAEAKKKEEARQKREAAERAAEAKKKEEARCAQLVRAAAGDGAAEGVDAAIAALLDRVARRSLVAADLELTAASLPCRDTGAFDGLAAAYATAAVTSLPTWMTTATPSEAAVTLLAQGKGAVGEDALANFGYHAEHAAEKALVSGNEERIARSQALCRAAEAIGHVRRKHCLGIAEVGSR